MPSSREVLAAYAAADGHARAALRDVVETLRNPHARQLLLAFVDAPYPMLQLSQVYPGVTYVTLVKRWHRYRLPPIHLIRRWVLCTRLARMLEAKVGTFTAACVELGMDQQNMRRILLPLTEGKTGPAEYLIAAGSAPMLAQFRALVDDHRAALEAWTPVENRLLRDVTPVLELRKRERKLEAELAQVRRDLRAAQEAA